MLICNTRILHALYKHQQRHHFKYIRAVSFWEVISKMSVLLSLTIMLVIVLTICVIAMTIALLLITKLRQNQTDKSFLLQNSTLDFTLRPCGDTYQKPRTINRIDRRSIDSFYWVPTSSPSTTQDYPVYSNKQNVQSMQSIYFV